MSILATIIGLGTAAAMVWLAWESRREGESAAERRGWQLAVLLPLPYLAAAWLPLPGGATAGWILLGLTGTATVVFLVPTGRPRGFPAPTACGRLDERNVMFSRAALEPGSERFDAHYAAQPAHRAPDDRFRNLPGLMESGANRYEPVSFAAAGATFDTVAQLVPLVTGTPTDKSHEMSSAAATRFVKGWTRNLGALACGVTELRDYHLYSHQGRGPRWGEAVTLDHQFAIAFTVEMDHANLAAAPEGPTVMESSQQYLRSGTIAVQLAQTIRRLGWRAEAHIDANYQVVCPLVARDAGLGEIGRMGLLMTPHLGPRVRIAVVTTDLPLDCDEAMDDPTVRHFCAICSKCADICPPRAIPVGKPAVVAGSERWQIDQEACFTYWCRVGTDCGQCLRVCPYSHPDTALHRLVRRGLKNSLLFRHLALRLDDLLYGRKPPPRDVPAWLPTRETPPSS